MTAAVINLAAVRAARAPNSVVALMLCAAFAKDVLGDEAQAAELHAKAVAARRALAALPGSEPEPPEAA